MEVTREGEARRRRFSCENSGLSPHRRNDPLIPAYVLPLAPIGSKAISMPISSTSGGGQAPKSVSLQSEWELDARAGRGLENHEFLPCFGLELSICTLPATCNVCHVRNAV